MSGSSKYRKAPEMTEMEEKLESILDDQKRLWEQTNEVLQECESCGEEKEIIDIVLDIIELMEKVEETIRNVEKLLQIF